MPLMLLGFLRVAWPYILAAALAGLVWWKADHWCNSACQAQAKIARTAEGKIRTLEAQIAEAQERAASAADKFSESLTNVPQGFRLQSSRYAASGPMDQHSSGGAGGGASPVSSPGGALIVTTEAVFARMKQLMERDNVLATGSMVPTGPQFA